MFASADELHWQRLPTESFANFRERAVMAAATVGKPIVIFGGLEGRHEIH